MNKKDIIKSIIKEYGVTSPLVIIFIPIDKEIKLIMFNY